MILIEIKIIILDIKIIDNLLRFMMSNNLIIVVKKRSEFLWTN